MAATPRELDPVPQDTLLNSCCHEASQLFKHYTQRKRRANGRHLGPNASRPLLPIQAFILMFSFFFTSKIKIPQYLAVHKQYLNRVKGRDHWDHIKFKKPISSVQNSKTVP